MPAPTLVDSYRVTFMVSSLIDPYNGPFYTDVVTVEAVDSDDAARKAEQWVYDHCHYANQRVEPLVSIAQVRLDSEVAYG